MSSSPNRQHGASLATLAVAMLPQPDDELVILLSCDHERLAALRSAPDRATTLERHLIANALKVGALRTDAPVAAEALASELAVDATERYRRAISAELLEAVERGATATELEAIVSVSLAREVGSTFAAFGIGREDH